MQTAEFSAPNAELIRLLPGGGFGSGKMDERFGKHAREGRFPVSFSIPPQKFAANILLDNARESWYTNLENKAEPSAVLTYGRLCRMGQYQNAGFSGGFAVLKARTGSVCACFVLILIVLRGGALLSAKVTTCS